MMEILESTIKEGSRSLHLRSWPATKPRRLLMSRPFVALTETELETDFRQPNDQIANVLEIS